MLAANTCAADIFKRAKRHGLFRVHEGPTPERLRTLREFLKVQGLKLEGGEEPAPGDYARLAKEIRARPDSRLIQSLLLRSMQQAIYTPDNSGHFGLSYEAYAHFTSPIRRYPDLLVHRVIKSIIQNKGHYVPAYGDMGHDDPVTRWRNIGDHCSAAERRADEASRDVEAWLKCQYMKSKIGEQLRGTVTGVAPFGLFITLDTLYVEGLVHVSELGAEYFQHNEVLHELRGERTGRRFRLYDSLVVQVARVDLDARRIEFQLVPSMIRTTRASKATERETEYAPPEDVEESELPKWLAEALAMQPRQPGALKRGKKSAGSRRADELIPSSEPLGPRGKQGLQGARGAKGTKADKNSKVQKADKGAKAGKAAKAAKPGQGKRVPVAGKSRKAKHSRRSK
ncbi:MAG: ribonuclease [Pseudomonadota bacterium]